MMPKYLVSASYTLEGVKGLLKEGGSSRQRAIKTLVETLGGKVEACYFAFGQNDVYVITDMPDDATMAALSLAIGASGAVSLETTVLLEPSTLDEAMDKTVDYRAPGT